MELGLIAILAGLLIWWAIAIFRDDDSGEQDKPVPLSSLEHCLSNADWYYENAYIDKVSHLIQRDECYREQSA